MRKEESTRRWWRRQILDKALHDNKDDGVYGDINRPERGSLKRKRCDYDDDDNDDGCIKPDKAAGHDDGDGGGGGMRSVSTTTTTTAATDNGAYPSRVI